MKELIFQSDVESYLLLVQNCKFSLFTLDNRTTLEEANFSYTLPCYIVASSLPIHSTLKEYTIVLRTLIDSETTKE